MRKVSYLLAERISQDPLETYFEKQRPPGVCKEIIHLHGIGYNNTIQKQNVFKPKTKSNTKKVQS